MTDSQSSLKAVSRNNRYTADNKAALSGAAYIFGEIMKKLKRLIPIYIIMVCCIVAFAGCGGGSYEGKDLVDKAKKLHTELEAAHITVSDKMSGDVLQEITYRFVGDVMQYMYVGRDLDTGEEYYEFNNGTELDTWHTGDTQWTAVAKGSEGYYNYSRAKRHYFADGELLLNDYAAAVRNAKIINEVGGIKRVLIQYDDAKIAQYEQMSGITDYSQEYWTDNIFNSNVIVDNGQCGSLFVTYSRDGKKYSYHIKIDSNDPAEPIERVEPPALAGNTENTQ